MFGCDTRMMCWNMTPGWCVRQDVEWQDGVCVWLYCCLNVVGLANADTRRVLEFGP